MVPGEGQTPMSPDVYVVGQLLAADNVPVCAVGMMDRLFLNSLIEID